MSDTSIELVVFKVADVATARLARTAAQDLVRGYPGFVSWTALEGVEETGLFCDFVVWADLESAKTAAAKVMADPGFAAYMASINAVVSMSHYSVWRRMAA